jgi:probable HAF family extracellular repeat protein
LESTDSVVYGVSADGSVVVGTASDAAGNWRAFRWTDLGGVQYLGTLEGKESVARGISADSSVVVGGTAENITATSINWLRAFRWTVGRGIEDLNTTYAALLSSGSVLKVAYAASRDGRYIVGKGLNGATGREEAYLLDTGTSKEQTVTDEGEPLYSEQPRERHLIRLQPRESRFIRLQMRESCHTP